MPATPRQLWSLRAALLVMIIGTVLVLLSPRARPVKILGALSTLFTAAVVLVVLRQAPRE